MKAVRVLIVDDSTSIRLLLEEALSRDPEIEVVGSAPNGELALLAVRTQRPDAIVLDLEMPVMNGLEFLARVRTKAPRTTVIVFSSFSSHAAEMTLKALWAGASDYVTKPRATDLKLARELVAAELTPRIKAHVERARRSAPAAEAPPAPPAPRIASAIWPAMETAHAASRPAARARVIAIAASTGGPTALAQVLRRLPVDFEAPLLVVQHMPPLFTGYLADGLDQQCALEVCEAQAGSRLEPGRIWIAPGDHHMMLSAHGEITLGSGPRENGCRPSADPLFRSVAEHFGPQALAVVLTGMGQDGLAGARAVRERGGGVIVQDEASSVIWGMPGSVARAGLADRVLPLDQIADHLIVRSRHGGGRRAA